VNKRQGAGGPGGRRRRAAARISLGTTWTAAATMRPGDCSTSRWLERVRSCAFPTTAIHRWWKSSGKFSEQQLQPG